MASVLVNGVPGVLSFYRDDEIKIDLSALEDAGVSIHYITFDLDLVSSVAHEGDMVATFTSADFYAIDVVVGEVLKAFEVTTEQVVVDLGIKEQVNGAIVIEELHNDLFQGGTELVVAVESDYIRIEDATVEFGGGMKGELSDSAYNAVSGRYEFIIYITSGAENGEGSITISNLEFDISASTPRGDYDLFLAGNALSILNEKYDKYEDSHLEDFLTVEDYMIVGLDVHATRVVAEINTVTGEAVVNGEEVTLLTTPYISSNDRTMVGIRDIATIFNIAPQNILFADGVVTILNGTNIIQFQEGSNIITSGNATFIMDEVMQIKDDRSYAPARFLAVALGLSDIQWDGNVAIFSNGN